MRQCELCGYTIPTALQRHHIKAKAKNGKGNASNLLTTCSNCHAVLTATMGKLNGETPAPRDVLRVATMLRKYALIVKARQQESKNGVLT